MYSNPPIHPGRIVAKVLGDSNNFKEWEKEVKMVSHRIIKMRALLK
jgi:aspartate/tyrosine/aromatic aminotransferase